MTFKSGSPATCTWQVPKDCTTFPAMITTRYKQLSRLRITGWQLLCAEVLPQATTTKIRHDQAFHPVMRIFKEVAPVQ